MHYRKRAQKYNSNGRFQTLFLKKVKFWNFENFCPPCDSTSKTSHFFYYFRFLTYFLHRIYFRPFSSISPPTHGVGGSNFQYRARFLCWITWWTKIFEIPKFSFFRNIVWKLPISTNRKLGFSSNKFLLLIFLNQCRFGIRFKLLLKAFLLSISVKNIFIPLLVWQTDELPVSSALIFTQGIQFYRYTGRLSYLDDT